MKRTSAVKLNGSLDFLEFVLDKGILPFHTLDEYLEYIEYTHSSLSAW